MKISVSDYLVKRLCEIGVNDFFGLPGDFNFEILYSIENNQNTNWIGCTNELNAGYAADGYARVKGYGALVTTYGVGELSAMNAIAGSFAENIPVIKIAGIPSTAVIKANKLLHHNLNPVDYKAFENMYSHITIGHTCLNEKNAKKEIDRLISLFINEKKPVYIAIPMDVATFEIEDSPCIKIKKSDTKTLNKVVDKILNKIEKSQYPSIVAGVMIKRFDAKDEYYKLLEKSKIPTTTLLMGKDLINDEIENSVGTYVGTLDNKNAYNTLKNSDCPIFIGTVISDINTQGFDIPHNPDDCINIQSDYCIIDNKKYKNVILKDVLEALAHNVPTKNYMKCHCEYKYEKVETNDNKLESNYFYSKIQDFVKSGDNLLFETGIALLASPKIDIKKGVQIENQTLWGSIGWATGATFGAALANRDKRTILITGEGSHQLTCTEVSTMFYNGLKPIIFVINNQGYTIERILSNDPMDSFNDIASWDYTKLPYVFSNDAYVKAVRTNAELDVVLDEINENQKERLCYIELHFDMMDLPELAQKMADKLNKAK